LHWRRDYHRQAPEAWGVPDAGTAKQRLGELGTHLARYLRRKTHSLSIVPQRKVAHSGS